MTLLSYCVAIACSSANSAIAFVVRKRYSVIFRTIVATLTSVNNILVGYQGIKMLLEMDPSYKFDVHIFKHVTWAYGSRIQSWSHL